jgi:hypothetical protein
LRGISIWEKENMNFIEGKPKKSVLDVTDIALNKTDCFYRGEADIFSLLLPKIFRKQYWLGPTVAFQPQESEKLRKLETGHIYEFKRLAPGLHSDLPGDNNPLNNLKWLFLMQHHGMPTRLLDWTQNILVATFFAVIGTKKDDENDGQVWSIKPLELNKAGGICFAFPLPGHPIVEYLSREMFYSLEKKVGLLKKLELREIPTHPVAILPPLCWSRMIAQSSVFTLHPKPRSGENIHVAPAELTRYKIPVKLKKKIRIELRHLGMEYRTLFPELDSISKDMTQKFLDIQ